MLCVFLAASMQHAWGMDDSHVAVSLMQEAKKRDREESVQRRLAAKIQMNKPTHLNDSENNLLVEEVRSAIANAQEQILTRLEQVEGRLAALEVKVTLYEQRFNN